MLLRETDPMNTNEPVPECDPSDDGGTGSPLVDAMNSFFAARYEKWAKDHGGEQD